MFRSIRCSLSNPCTGLSSLSKLRQIHRFENACMHACPHNHTHARTRTHAHVHTHCTWSYLPFLYTSSANLVHQQVLDWRYWSHPIAGCRLAACSQWATSPPSFVIFLLSNAPCFTRVRGLVRLFSGLTCCVCNQALLAWGNYSRTHTLRWICEVACKCGLSFIFSERKARSHLQEYMYWTREHAHLPC